MKDTPDIQITTTQRDFDNADNPVTCSIVWSACLEDCTVHAWMQLFEQVLRAQGFSDRVIMSGACQLAFNERRSDADMKAVADEYGLTLQELALEP
jgi:hypothetical protein